MVPDCEDCCRVAFVECFRSKPISDVQSMSLCVERVTFRKYSIKAFTIECIFKWFVVLITFTHPLKGVNCIY